MPKNFVQEPFSVSLFSGIEKFHALEGYVTFFCRIFLSDSAKILPKETFQCFVNFGYRKSLDKRGGGGSEYQDSPSKVFCLRVPKTFIEEPLCAVFRKVSKREKIYGLEAGRRVSSFSLENFLSHSAENFRRRTILCCVSENFC